MKHRCNLTLSYTNNKVKLRGKKRSLFLSPLIENILHNLCCNLWRSRPVTRNYPGLLRNEKSGIAVCGGTMTQGIIALFSLIFQLGNYSPLHIFAGSISQSFVNFRQFIFGHFVNFRQMFCICKTPIHQISPCRRTKIHLIIIVLQQYYKWRVTKK